jgi:sodium-dependent dicarboxylate transporter 2/3/5
MDQFGIIPMITGALEGHMSIILIIVFTVFLTNLISNIVTTTVSYNLMMPIVLATGVISPELTAILVGMCASMAYATPPAIAHVALAAGSEYCNTKTMLIYGGIASIISIIFVALMA